MIYNNTAVKKRFDIFAVKDFFNSLTAAVKSKKKTAETEEVTDGYIKLSDIVQPPCPTSDKYFIREKDYKRIRDIYKIAVMTENLGITEDEYENLFKPFRFKFFGYDASGYTLTEKKYRRFYEIYCNYITAFYKMTDEN
ncbi:MAG: hypothetical protein LUC97_07675 [Clostridiales bacterium]|nr:hypothetical protein [Clostridiales bacterium]